LKILAFGNVTSTNSGGIFLTLACFLHHSVVVACRDRDREREGEAERICVEIVIFVVGVCVFLEG